MYTSVMLLLTYKKKRVRWYYEYSRHSEPKKQLRFWCFCVTVQFSLVSGDIHYPTAGGKRVRWYYEYSVVNGP